VVRAYTDISARASAITSGIVLVGSIVFLAPMSPNENPLRERSGHDVGWQLAIHLGLVVSGVLLAWMDRLSSSTSADTVPK
jgi:uncharacterized membrane protein YqhA